MSNEELILQIKSGEDVTNNMLQLWKQNTGIVNKCIKRYSAYVDIEDLRQETYIGLCEAVEKYNPDMQISFCSYFVWWIKKSVQVCMETYGNAFTVPRHMRTKTYNCKKFINTFSMNKGSEPNKKEIAYHFGISLTETESILRAIALENIMSIDDKDSENLSVAETVSSGEDIESNVIEKTDSERIKKVLWNIVDSLGDEQSEIIRSKYIDNMTLRDMSESLNLPYHTIRQFENSALRAMRRHSCSKLIKPYFDNYISRSSYCYNNAGYSNFKYSGGSVEENMIIRHLDGYGGK